MLPFSSARVAASGVRTDAERRPERPLVAGVLVAGVDVQARCQFLDDADDAEHEHDVDATEWREDVQRHRLEDEQEAMAAIRRR